MKYLLLGVFFILSYLTSVAQMPNTFTKQGIVGFLKKDSSYLADSTYRTARLTDEQKKLIKLELATRVQQAINTIEDDSLRWKSLYTNLWTDAERMNIVSDLRNFRNYLLAPPGTTYTSAGFAPSSNILDSMLFYAPLYDHNLAQETGTVYTKTSLARTSPLNHFLLFWLDSTMRIDNIQSLQMDNSYITGWRQLEKAYRDCNNAIAELKKHLDSPCINNKDTGNYYALIVNFQQVINQDTVLNLLRQRNFFKKWFWYTGGYMYINPLIYTTADKRYPASEKRVLLDSFKLSELNNLPNEKNEDSLLNRLLSTRKIRSEQLSLFKKYNTLFKKDIPFKEYRQTDYFYYDAATGYKCLNENKQWPYKDTRKGMALVAYNVPAKDTLKISFSKSINIPDQSAALQAFNKTLDDGQLTSILGNVAGINTFFEKLGLNGRSGGIKRQIIPNVISANGAQISVLDQSPATVTQIFANKKEKYTDAMKMAKLMQTSSFIDGYESYQNFDSLSSLILEKATINKKTAIKEKEYKVTVGTRDILILKNVLSDKSNIITASFLKHRSAECNNCDVEINKCLLVSFLKDDYCYDFNYKDKAELQKDADSLVARLKCFIDSVQTRDSIFYTRLDTLQNKYLPLLKSYVSIIQRSLPPTLHYKNKPWLFEEEKLDEMPEFRTVVFAPKLPNGDTAKKIVYEVTSTLPGRLIDGKIPGEANTVISNNFKYARRHWIDYSVGLGYITSDYDLKTNSGNSLPEITEGEKFKPIAGLHIYPLGLLKVNDRFAVPDWYTRLSLFAGVGIKKPLENLYPGIGYDIVPGIRIIGGMHFYKDTRYTISNGAVIDQASSLKNSGGYIAVNIEPVSFAKLLNLFK